MEKYLVVISDTAILDLEHIYEYIAFELCAPENALEKYKRITKAISSLEYFPRRYALFSSEPEQSLGIRRFVVDKYLICYYIDSKTVFVTDVLYGASNVHERLTKRHF